jgi:KipI family sensor histidine kinase inhibitor
MGSSTGETETVRFLPAGDGALVVDFGNRVDRGLSARVLELSARVRGLALDGLVTTLPTFRSLMVRYDPLRLSGESLTQTIRTLLDDLGRAQTFQKLWRVPVCYAPQFAPDLAEVAERVGLQPDDVVAIHTRTQFYVYMVGFLPGFPYLGDLPEQLHLPRRKDPRVRVPAGSVAIAISLTAIYAVESPGGWHLIGATPIRLFDPDWARPSLFAPGDQLRFDPVTAAEYESIRASVEAGRYAVRCEEIPA